MINNLSNRTCAWLMGGLLSSVAVLAIVIAHMQDIAAAWLWIRWVLALIAAILALYGLYLLWHQVHTRHLNRSQQAEEIRLLVSGYEDEKWRADQGLLHAQQMEQARLEIEREKVRTEQMKAQLEHERLMTIASWQAQHVTVPSGHGLYIREESGYNMVQAPHVAGILPEAGAVPQLKAGRPVMIPAPKDLPSTFDLLDIFQHGRIAPDHMFLGKLDGDEPLYIDAVKKLCHGAINAITGRGKTIIKRGLEAQFLSFGFEVIDLDIKFTLIDEEGLDYRPFAKHLLGQPPIEVQPGLFIPRLEVDAKRIALVLQWLAEVEVPRRLDQYHRGVHNSKTLYVFVEEMLYLVSKCPEVSEYLKEILPVARSLGIKIFCSAQNFQVQSIQLPGGMRENFETAYYMGGDDLSGAKLLDISSADLLKWLTLHNITLGKSISLLRNNFLVEKPRLMRVGMASNEAVYYLLGRANAFTFESATGHLVRESFGSPAMPDSEPLQGTLRESPEFRQEAKLRLIKGSSEENEAGLPEDGLNPLESRTSGTPERLPKNEAGLPENDLNPLESRTSGTPELGPDDLMLSELQIKLFISFYEDCGNIGASLSRIKNESGKGLGQRYYKHAGWLVKHYKLRKEA